jgi:nucleotidyltransferase substrate binding protein (TIGR01987 family)
MEKLNLTPLEKTLASLEEVLQLNKTAITRDSAIQRFEYTYELSIKFLKRLLKRMAATPQTIDQMDYKDMIREGAKAGIIHEPEAWFVYREARNETSHAYDETKAEKVYARLPQFAQDARGLLDQLKNLDQKFR